LTSGMRFFRRNLRPCRRSPIEAAALCGDQTTASHAST
jgi:hypothetical protein